MKYSIVLAAFLGIGLVFATSLKSEAFCLAFCDDSDSTEIAEVGISEESNISDSSVSAGRGNTTATNLSNTVVIGGDVVTTQSNFIGGIGVNKGDINQNNTANITGQQSIRDNDMRDFSSGRRR